MKNATGVPSLIDVLKSRIHNLECALVAMDSRLRALELRGISTPSVPLPHYPTKPLIPAPTNPYPLTPPWVVTCGPIGHSDFSTGHAEGRLNDRRS